MREYYPISAYYLRESFLDHRVAELAARIPLRMKIQGRRGKLILRHLLNAQAPSHLFDRPKSGFAVPVGDWIRGPLRPWAEDLLDRTALKNDGIFDHENVHRRWAAHLAGDRNSTQAVWTVLMFQAWMKQIRSGKSPD